MASCTVTINEVELDVSFSYWPFLHATFADPEEGGDFEVEHIYLNGDEIKFLAAHVMEDVNAQVRDHINAELKREVDEEAEAKMDAAVDYLGYAA